jgi:hypothetical protein
MSLFADSHGDAPLFRIWAAIQLGEASLTHSVRIMLMVLAYGVLFKSVNLAEAGLLVEGTVTPDFVLEIFDVWLLCYTECQFK